VVFLVDRREEVCSLSLFFYFDIRNWWVLVMDCLFCDDVVGRDGCVMEILSDGAERMAWRYCDRQGSSD